MADWLRPVFGRNRSSLHVSATTSPAADGATFGDTHTDDTSTPTKLGPSSRVASLISIRTNTPPPSISHDAIFNVRSTTKAYPRPDVDRMVETLKVVMMTQESLIPVPQEYNGHILHLLEAYQGLQERLAKEQDAISELNIRHTADLEEFESLAMEWELKEKDYKAEVKRLEVMLSKTDGGVESVAVARSKSKVYGTKMFSESVGSGMNTIKGRHVVRELKDTEDLNKRNEEIVRANAHRVEIVPLFHTDTNTICKGSPIFTGSSAPEAQPTSSVHSQECSPPLGTNDAPPSEEQGMLQIPTNLVETIPQPRLSPQNLRAINNTNIFNLDVPICRPGPPPPRLDLMNESSKRGREKSKPSVTDASTSESGSESYKSNAEALGGDGLGIGLSYLHLGTYPLTGPTINSVPSTLVDNTQASSVHSQAHSVTKHRFSFQPGDDIDVLSPTLGADLHRVQRIVKQIQQVGRSPPRSESQTKSFPSFQSRSSASAVAAKPRIPLQFPMLRKRSFEDKSPVNISRGDSASSVVTTILHSSRHDSLEVHTHAKSCNPGQSITKTRTRRSENVDAITSGSLVQKNDAIVAAATAFSGATKAGLPQHLQPDIQDHRRTTQRQRTERSESTIEGRGKKTSGEGTIV